MAVLLEVYLWVKHAELALGLHDVCADNALGLHNVCASLGGCVCGQISS